MFCRACGFELPDTARFCRSCGERHLGKLAANPNGNPEQTKQTSSSSINRTQAGDAGVAPLVKAAPLQPISAAQGLTSIEAPRPLSFGEEAAAVSERPKAQQPPKIRRNNSAQAPAGLAHESQKDPKSGALGWKTAAGVVGSCLVVVGASVAGLYLYNAQVREENAKTATTLAIEQEKVRAEKEALVAREAQINNEKARISKQEEEQRLERERQAAAVAAATAEPEPLESASQSSPSKNPLSQATNCVDIASCTSAALSAVGPKDAMALELALAKIDEFEKPARGSRKIARKLNEQGLQQLEAGNLAAALELLGRAAVEDPADVEIMSNLAGAAVRAKSTALAESALHMAIRLNPRRTITWVAYAEYSLQKGGNAALLAPKALLLAYEYSGNQEKTLNYFDEKAISSDSEQLRRLYESTSKVARIALASAPAGS